MDRADSLQALVDALSLALGRSVLIDDGALRPLAYSRQWGEIDLVRSESILRRGASAAVRQALYAQGIAAAEGVVRTRPAPEIAMQERVCAPIRRGAHVLGYLWLLDARHDLDAEQLDRVAATARHVARILDSPSLPLADERALVARLCAADAGQRHAAAEEARARALLPDRALVVALVASAAGADVRASVRRALQRLAPGHALAGSEADRILLLISLEDPAIAVLSEHEVAGWLLEVADEDVVVGQSAAVAGLGEVPAGRRQAEVALRVARAGAPGVRQAAWSTLGAERLLAQLPASAVDDLPPRLARLLREEPVLAETLASFLDAAGDVKATAARLCLHRSGLYYRLRRIEELTGLHLDRGEDRLLAHLAVRLARDARGAPAPSLHSQSSSG